MTCQATGGRLLLLREELPIWGTKTLMFGDLCLLSVFRNIPETSPVENVMSLLSCLRSRFTFHALKHWRAWIFYTQMRLQRIIYYDSSSPNDAQDLRVEKMKLPAASRQESLEVSFFATWMLYLTDSFKEEISAFLKKNGRGRNSAVITGMADISFSSYSSYSSWNGVTTIITDWTGSFAFGWAGDYDDRSFCSKNWLWWLKSMQSCVIMKSSRLCQFAKCLCWQNWGVVRVSLTGATGLFSILKQMTNTANFSEFMTVFWVRSGIF